MKNKNLPPLKGQRKRNESLVETEDNHQKKTPKKYRVNFQANINELAMRSHSNIRRSQEEEEE